MDEIKWLEGAINTTPERLDEITAKLTAAGFTSAAVEVTRRYERSELEAMADQLDPAQLPAGVTLAEAVDALDGAFASAFIRAAKPHA